MKDNNQHKEYILNPGEAIARYMKLEEEIAQSHFLSEYQKLGVNLNFTYFWATDLFRCLLKKADITAQQFNVLRILRGQHPKACTVNLVKARMLDKSSDVSRIVDRLYKKKLLKRSQCETDRRSLDVKITKKGLALLDSLSEIDGFFPLLFSNLSEEEAATMNALLDKARDIPAEQMEYFEKLCPDLTSRYGIQKDEPEAQNT